MSDAADLTVRRTIVASAERLFDAWLDAASFSRWMRPSAISETRAENDPRVGGEFRIVMVRDEADVVHRGTYREIDRPRRLVFTWSSPSTQFHDSVVTVTFEPASEGSTLVTVHQTGLPDVQSRADHTEGWTEILAGLARLHDAAESRASNERMEAIMNDHVRSPGLPDVVDRATWMEAREALFAREKAHTREGDAIAAARRRLPMVEVDASIEVIGSRGAVTILDVFEGRQQLIAYFHAWWPGRPAAEQCEGCTFFNSQVRELSYLHSRDATYAALCKGPYDESVRYRDFLGLEMPWYSVEATAPQLLEGRDWERHHLVCYVRDGERVFETYYTGGRGVEIMAPTHGLLDMTVYGRQEEWEDSPTGWPQPWGDATNPEVWRTNGRPIAQWSRIAAGRSDDLS